MNRPCVGVVLLALFAAGEAQAEPASLTAADKAAAFRAAGFKLQGTEWTRCEDDVTASRQSGSIELADLNQDGAPEAWVRESSLFCYGNIAEAFVLLTRRPSGWKVILDEVGSALELPTGYLGWPDIEVSGPGVGAMPVYRFNGSRYVRHGK